MKWLQRLAQRIEIPEKHTAAVNRMMSWTYSAVLSACGCSGVVDSLKIFGIDLPYNYALTNVIKAWLALSL